MDSIGGYSQSIQDWYASYKRHGLAGLLNHIKTAFIPR